jgi:hypothetical protein
MSIDDYYTFLILVVVVVVKVNIRYRLIRMNWDLGYLLQHLEVLAFSDSGLRLLSKINFHACSQPLCNTLCYAVFVKLVNQNRR